MKQPKGHHLQPAALRGSAGKVLVGLIIDLAMGLVALTALPPRALSAPGDVRARVKLPGPCVKGLTWDGRYLWAADHKTDKLYQIDPRTGAVVRTIETPGHRPAGLAWGKGRLWNLDLEEKLIYQIDPTRRTVTHTVESPVSRPRALAWASGWLWISDAKTKSLFRIDPEDGTTVDKIPAPTGNVDGLAWDGRYLWVTDRLRDRIYMVEPKAGEVIFSVKAPGPHATGLAFDGKDLWVADYQTDLAYRLVRYDGVKLRRKLRKSQEVEYTYQVRNYGPGPLTRVELFIGVPQNDPSQQLLSPVAFLTRGGRWLNEGREQKIVAYRFGSVPSGKTVTVGYKVRANLYDVRYFPFPHLIRPLSSVPASVRSLYLKDDRKYGTRHPVIKKAVAAAVKGERNPYFMARKIYGYIHKRMRYELAGGWNVAPRVLLRGTGSCSEYSFVFISMCRAAGIPARYVGSLVVRKDDASYDDVFHRWVEIYLPGFGWLPVDPSRGDKKEQAARGDAFHHLTANFLITTRSSGPSRYLGWTYNGHASWHCLGRCKVVTETIAEWSPLGHKRSKKQ